MPELSTSTFLALALESNLFQEVNVDAYSGQVLEDSIESPADEAKEKAQERKIEPIRGPQREQSSTARISG